MKLENQVCSLDLAKRLKKLGVKQESLWWWVFQEKVWKLENRHIVKMVSGMVKMSAYPKLTKMPPTYSAFTVAELGEMLPFDRIGWYGKTLNGDWRIDEKEGGHTGKMVIAVTEANMRAKMVIYLKEKGLK